MAVGEMPNHGHTGVISGGGNHNHTYNELVTKSNGGYRGYYHLNTDNAFEPAYTSSNGTHTHTVTLSNTGANQPHNNLQPYISCYIWCRTA